MKKKKCRKKKKLPFLQSKYCERKMYDEKLPLTITFERKQWLEYLQYARISISLKFCNDLSLVLMLMIRDNGVLFSLYTQTIVCMHIFYLPISHSVYHAKDLVKWHVFRICTFLRFYVFFRKIKTQRFRLTLFSIETVCKQIVSFQC